MDINILDGKILTKIEIADDKSNIKFVCKYGSKYLMHHYPDCCENVEVDEIIGDIKDLIDTPIIEAREETNSESNPEGVKKECQDSFTWTFYIFRTIKGSVTIRWYGESNGYYSESVDFEKIEEE